MLTVTRKKPTYDCGISKNGEPLVLLPASKNTFDEISEFGETVKNGDSASKLKETYKLALIILNTNTAGIEITENEVNEIDPMTIISIIREYTEFLQGLRNDPN